MRKESKKNTYPASDGTRYSKQQINRLVREAKNQKLSEQRERYGYNFCEECGVSSGTYLDCSHNVSVDQCQKRGIVELAWDTSNFTILCRADHQKKDKLNLQFKIDDS